MIAGASRTMTIERCQTRWRVAGAARRSSAAISEPAIKIADVRASKSTVTYRPSFLARSINADSRVRSSSDSDPESTSAAAACAAEPSKNVWTMRVRAEWRALSRGTDGR
jgi:hypothetical protein